LFFIAIGNFERMNEQNSLLEGHSDAEKGAYLAAIASIATADHQADQQELSYLEDLCDAADLSETQKAQVTNAASDRTGQGLGQHLDTLKNSELRFSLVTDMIAFARADGSYHETERQQIEKVAQHLGVNQQQFSLLDQFTEKAAESKAPPEEKMSPSFLGSLGIGDKMQMAGINTGSLFKGLIGIAGPMILSKVLGGMFGRRGRTGGVGGGLFPGGGGIGSGGGMLGGLGSLIGMLAGGRGFGKSGGLLGRLGF
jgi:uncharacterized tellurite resistance protein B-like protein